MKFVINLTLEDVQAAINEYVRNKFPYVTIQDLTLEYENHGDAYEPEMVLCGVNVVVAAINDKEIH